MHGKREGNRSEHLGRGRRLPMSAIGTSCGELGDEAIDAVTQPEYVTGIDWPGGVISSSASPIGSPCNRNPALESAYDECIPSAGDHFEWGGLHVEVAGMDGRRVDKSLVVPVRADSANPGG